MLSWEIIYSSKITVEEDNLFYRCQSRNSKFNENFFCRYQKYIRTNSDDGVDTNELEIHESIEMIHKVYPETNSGSF